MMRTFSIAAVALALCMAQVRPPLAQTPPPDRAPAPKPPAITDDKPYDVQLFRLAELIGSLHYLRVLCGGTEAQAWRQQMRELVAAEGTNALRRAKLVESFNRGYRGYARTYRSCTPPALTAIDRFMEQGAAIADALASDKL